MPLKRWNSSFTRNSFMPEHINYRGLLAIHDRSGDYAVQGSNRMPCVSLKFRVLHATCVSCIILLMMFGRPQRQNRTTWHKMSEFYQSAFKLLLISTRDVCVLYKSQTDGCPNHYTRYRALISISKASRQWAFSLEPLDMYAIIRILQVGLGFVWKDIAAFLYPALPGTPELPPLFILHCQGKPQ